MFKKIYIEITNKCNLKCSFCSGNKREKEYLDIDKFKELLDRIKGHTKYIYFHVMGEPLMHPNINEFIDIGSKNFFVNITSNGYLIRKIVNNKNIRQLNISLHSFKESNGKSIEEYMKDVMECADKLNSYGTIINYRMWIRGSNKERIIKYLEERYKVNINSERRVKLDNNIYYEVEEEFIWPSMDNSYYNCEGSCRGTRDHIGVLVDGTVIPCCLDSNGIINLGNIYNDELNDIIKSDKFLEIRDGFLKNKKIHELCRKCNFYDLRRY